MKGLRLLCVVCMTILLSAAAGAVTGAWAGTAEEIARCEKELAAAQKDLNAQRKNLLESPELVNIRKDIAAMDSTIKAKDKEIADTLDSKINKNPAYLELAARVKDLNALNAELRRYRMDAENDPEVKKAQKEARELRVKAQALDAEARKAADLKFNSDPKAKELLAKQSGLKSAVKEESDFRRGVMNDAQVRALQTESTELKKKAAARNNELKGKADSALKADKKLKPLEVKVKELSQKLAELRKQVSPAKAGAVRAQAKGAAAKKK